ncbi:hypothetical protein B5M09_009344 [Aphanomyces astaci]|uniref:Uncharacterized protein n=1 Tax=Aphanomyces astaci TaxID=112090 RepID=A0A3R7Y5Y6_APHAT|nr:hypothetical protein B5M09_009344 [Aphanomyces astaci]
MAIKRTLDSTADFAAPTLHGGTSPAPAQYALFSPTHAAGGEGGGTHINGKRLRAPDVHGFSASEMKDVSAISQWIRHVFE